MSEDIGKGRWALILGASSGFGEACARSLAEAEAEAEALGALSLLALVCGAFLVYNTMSFSVVQRRRLIGTMRAVGAHEPGPVETGERDGGADHCPGQALRRHEGA